MCKHSLVSKIIAHASVCSCSSNEVWVTSCCCACANTAWCICCSSKSCCLRSGALLPATPRRAAGTGCWHWLLALAARTGRYLALGTTILAMMLCVCSTDAKHLQHDSLQCGCVTHRCNMLPTATKPAAHAKSWQGTCNILVELLAPWPLACLCNTCNTMILLAQDSLVTPTEDLQRLQHLLLHIPAAWSRRQKELTRGFTQTTDEWMIASLGLKLISRPASCIE